MEVLKVAQQMQRIIEALRDEGKKSEDLIQAKGDTTRAYRKGRAVRAMAHKQAGLAVTLIKHQADGDAGQLEAEMIIATETLKAHWVRMENLRAQLNGYQSINRYLSSTE